MITRIEIENFRGVKTGGVDGLSPLSIVVGPNNSGKSTLLEALALIEGDHAGRLLSQLLRRGGPPIDAVRWITGLEARISVFDHVRPSEDQPDESSVSLTIKVGGTPKSEDHAAAVREGLNAPTLFQIHSTFGSSAHMNSLTFVDSNGRIATTGVSNELAPPYHTRLLDLQTVNRDSQLEDAFSEIQRSGGRLKQVLSALQTSMPGLTDLQILKTASSGNFVLHTFRGNEIPVPAYVAGDGFKRFLSIAAACVATEEPALILLEEPESFQHPRYLTELVALLLDLASPRRQIILATHSVELIDLLLHASTDEKPYPTVHRLRLDNGVLRATTLSHSRAREARDELVQDLRA